MEDDGILSSGRLNRLVHGPGGRGFRTEWVIIVGNLAPRTIRVKQFLNVWIAVSRRVTRGLRMKQVEGVLASNFSPPPRPYRLRCARREFEMARARARCRARMDDRGHPLVTPFVTLR